MSRIEEALAKAAEMNSGYQAWAASSRVSTQTPRRMALTDHGADDGPSRLPEESLVVINEPLAPVAEEFRKLKESLVRMTRRERFDNLVAVTSATAGEGKTMTAINLAASLAREFDHTVLLIDADLRRPCVHKYLGLGKAPKGLSDCLREGLDVGEVLARTTIGKLSVIPAGTPVPNPVELFTSEAMRQLLQEIKLRYPDRYVIIDCPPVLPFAETRSIATTADGAILVVKEGMATLNQIQEAIETLDNKVLGIVYNGAQSTGRSPYYSSYYYAE